MSHGNLINRIQERSQQIVPVVGMGCTELFSHDRHAYTVIATGRDLRGDVVAFTAQRDNTTRTDKHGMSDAQSYDYAPNHEGQTVMVSRRPNGQWVTMGEGAKNGTKWAIGYRDEHYDYSF
jgi:hypothetical protein